ncbi:hypothetical protein AGMMS50256_31700 [Betaproteobacteria bacterium]|nr:hypothetical protein AGMMS50256_31700 [Betaproteobacteria bacterium]
MVISTANDAAPIVSMYNDAKFAVDLYNEANTQDWSNFLRDTIAATLGVVAGAPFLPLNPAYALAADTIMSDRYKKAYDAAYKISQAQDWSKLFDLMDDIVDLWEKLSLSDFFSDKPFDPYGIDPTTVNVPYLNSRKLNSPLILDLDGDGIEIRQLVSGASSQILFDHNDDGVRTGTAWVKSDDGLLVLDRNSNGVIDSGRELFGNNTLLSNGQTASDGYAALGELDSNDDGFIDALDTFFDQLSVWRDLDQDGVSDANELMTLIEAGITQIGLAKTSGTQTLADGTKLDGTGSFTINGQTHTYTDAWLADNGFYREFTNPVTLTDDAKTLPGMSGSGKVRDLREAASLNAQLVSDVNGLTGDLTRPQMLASLDSLIDHWADTSTMETSIQQAAGKNYVLFYLIPGMSVTDWFKIYATPTSTNMSSGSSGSSGGTGNSGGYYAYIPDEAEEARLEALKAEHQRVTHLVEILEHFNALTFVDVAILRSASNDDCWKMAV